jgi:condensin complex subunit 3
MFLKCAYYCLFSQFTDFWSLSKAYKMPPHSSASTAASSMTEIMDTLPVAVKTLFQNSQHVSSTHHKNVIALRRLQLASAAVRPEDDVYAGERAFNEVFSQCIFRVLPLKRTEPCALKIIKFMSAFFQYSHEKGELLIDQVL